MTHPQAATWFIHTVSKKARASRDSNGDPSFGALSTFLARVERDYKIVKSADGTDVATTHVLVTDEVIKPDDLIFLPSIAGETADDTSTNAQGRRPQSIRVATTKAGDRSLFEVRF